MSRWQSQLGPLGDGPMRQFGAWYRQACDEQILLPERAALATATAEGKPSVRYVLVRGYEEAGLIFFTSYDSRKAQELAENPYAALVFHWRACGLQVRAEGRVEKVSAELSRRYYDSRPAGSRASAIVSPQSSAVASYRELKRQAEALLHRGEEQLQRPQNWGGYRLLPDTFEFWTEKENRMHEREHWSLRERNWIRQWLAP